MLVAQNPVAKPAKKRVVKDDLLPPPATSTACRALCSHHGNLDESAGEGAVSGRVCASV